MAEGLDPFVKADAATRLGSTETGNLFAFGCLDTASG